MDAKNRSVAVCIVEQKRILERKRSEKILKWDTKVNSHRAQQSESCQQFWLSNSSRAWGIKLRLKKVMDHRRENEAAEETVVNKSFRFCFEKKQKIK